MFKGFRAIFILFVLILIGVMVSSVGLAARDDRDYGWHEDTAAIANQFLERLTIAYKTANVPLFVSLYNDPSAVVDVTRNENSFYTSDTLKSELEETVAGLTGIQCAFTDRQISAEGDMIMIKTLRSLSANEIPIIANCGMLMILRKSFTHRQPWNYVVTDQILLMEEYLPKPDSSSSIQSGSTGQAPVHKKHRHLIW